MRLICQICHAVQPVTMADEADEDPRTQAIRRTFRAEHIELCGVGSVRFEFAPVDAIEIDEEAWMKYLEAAVNKPADVTVSTDGFFSRRIVRDGQTHHVRVCEDCWQNIPRYVDFPFGLTSPESDGLAEAVPKWAPDVVETDAPQRAHALRHLAKAVCVACYLAAFKRVYPDALPPVFSLAVIGDGAPVTPPPVMAAEESGRVTIARFDQSNA